jgi:N-hydroxyarylamine O-acetyltransferase
MSNHRIDVDAYLRRIGLVSRPAADAEGLRALQVAHLHTVPFENLDILAGRPISLELAAIEAKIVGAHRGGFCYELNGLFATLLDALGFRASLLAAEVRSPETGEWGPPFDHLVLRVDLDDPWLVDVGFGDGCPEPMPLRDGAAVRDGSERVFSLTGDASGWLLSVRSPEDETPEALYRFTETTHALADYEATCRIQETESALFTGHRIAEVLTSDSRMTLFDNLLIVHIGTERTTREIHEAEVPALLRDRFGIQTPAKVSSPLARP